MRPAFYKAIQFSASILILIEGIKALDTEFYFPWFWLITGLLMLALVPLAPSLATKFLLSGFVIFILEGIVLAFLAVKFWGNDKPYAALLYIVPAVIMWLTAFLNIRKYKLK